MPKHKGQATGAKMRTREQILAALRGAKIDLECETDEARAVLVLEVVEQIAHSIEALVDQIHTDALTNERRWKIANAYIRSRYSGDKQANRELEAELKRLGEEGNT